MTPKQREARDLHDKLKSNQKVADVLGKSKSAVQQLIAAARAHENADISIQGAMASAGMQDASVLHSGWIKTDEASLYFQMPKADRSVDLNDVAEAIQAAMSAIKPANVSAPPKTTESDLLTLYPLPDVHAGMRTKGWGLQDSVDRVTAGFARCIGSSPGSRDAVILVLGDLLHHNDGTNQTQSGHVLDVAASVEDTAAAMVEAIAYGIETALTKHERVTVSVLKGNHDRDAYLIVLFSLAERYRKPPRVDVQRKEGSFFVMQHGTCMLFAHHGDKAKPERLVFQMADEYPEIWGKTRQRFCFTGHLHHLKSADIGGVSWEQLRAVTPRDDYSRTNSYTARSEMQAITYCRKEGEVSRVKVAL